MSGINFDTTCTYIQGDQKVFVHLTITVKNRCTETFWSPCIMLFIPCIFLYSTFCNQRNAPIKIQYNRSYNALHIRRQLLQVSAPSCHFQGVY